MKSGSGQGSIQTRSCPCNSPSHRRMPPQVPLPRPPCQRLARRRQRLQGRSRSSQPPRSDGACRVWPEERRLALRLWAVRICTCGWELPGRCLMLIGSRQGHGQVWSAEIWRSFTLDHMLICTGCGSPACSPGDAVGCRRSVIMRRHNSYASCESMNK